MTRQIESMTAKQLLCRLNGAYKKLLGKSEDSKLIRRDIVSFSKLGVYDPNTVYSDRVAAELYGRQQMALHMLQHLDIEPTEIIELQNEAYTQSSNLNED